MSVYGMAYSNSKNSTFTILFFGAPEKQNLLNGITREAPATQITNTRDKSKFYSLLSSNAINLILVDIDQEDLQPLDFLSHLFETTKTAPVFCITESVPLSISLKAIKLGAKEVINIIEEPKKLIKETARIFHRWKEQDEGENLHHQQKVKFDFSSIIGQSPAMQRIFKIAGRIIQRKWVTVLIRGETGTGKEVMARAIHYNSFNQFQSFVEINCNALPENLLESELFGYEKGAFTDAKTQKKGLFELAQNGTLFLDEIGEISLAMQVKLLKALEEKKIRRLGGTEDIHINTRIISATNRNLQEAVKENRFRNDLYYRLNVVTLHLPALRERGDDIILLANHFLKHFAEEYESPLQDFTPEAESLLKSYQWPGNVRELQHTIERIALLADGDKVTPAMLQETIDSETPAVMSEKRQSTHLVIDIPSEGMSLDNGEKILIEAVLNSTDWNKRRAAQILKISRPRLDRKIEKYNLR